MGRGWNFEEIFLDTGCSRVVGRWDFLDQTIFYPGCLENLYLSCFKCSGKWLKNFAVFGLLSWHRKRDCQNSAWQSIWPKPVNPVCNKWVESGRIYGFQPRFLNLAPLNWDGPQWRKWPKIWSIGVFGHISPDYGLSKGLWAIYESCGVLCSPMWP